MPEFRAKLADSQLNLDYPVWVDDDAFDLDRLLLRIVGPGPDARLWRLADDFNVALEELLDCADPARI